MNVGREVKKLEFKVLKVNRNKKIPSYHIVIAKKRSATNSRLDKVGFFHFAKKFHPGFYRKKNIKLLGLNFDKIKSYIISGATFNKVFFKILIC